MTRYSAYKNYYSYTTHIITHIIYSIVYFLNKYNLLKINFILTVINLILTVTWTSYYFL